MTELERYRLRREIAYRAMLSRSMMYGKTYDQSRLFYAGCYWAEKKIWLHLLGW